MQLKYGKDELKRETFNSQRGPMSNLEYMELIENLHRQKFNDDPSIKQILLFFFTDEMDGNIINALQAMHKETKWNIILYCRYSCPVIPGFPLHRIVLARFEKLGS